jgi:hypothetical protein
MTLLIIADIYFDINEDDVGDSNEMLQERLQVSYIGRITDAKSEDELAEFISDECGWNVKRIRCVEL